MFYAVSSGCRTSMAVQVRVGGLVYFDSVRQSAAGTPSAESSANRIYTEDERQILNRFRTDRVEGADEPLKRRHLDVTA